MKAFVIFALASGLTFGLPLAHGEENQAKLVEHLKAFEPSLGEWVITAKSHGGVATGKASIRPLALGNAVMLDFKLMVQGQVVVSAIRIWHWKPESSRIGVYSVDSMGSYQFGSLLEKEGHLLEVFSGYGASGRQEDGTARIEHPNADRILVTVFPRVDGIDEEEATIEYRRVK